MENLKGNLDTKICDIFSGSNNQETLREFIKESEETFGITSADIDNFTEEQLRAYIGELDYLWSK